MQFSFRLSSGRAHRVFAVALSTLMLVPGRNRICGRLVVARSLTLALFVSAFAPISALAAPAEPVLDVLTISTAEATIAPLGVQPLNDLRSRNNSGGPVSVEVLLGSSSSRFASALAETSGNMEVGVVEPQFFFRGNMDAKAFTFLAITNNSDIFLRGIPLTFGIQPGEVILFDFAGRNFRDAGAPHARISATIFMERFADTGGGPIETIPLFDYTLDVRGGFGQIALDNPHNLVLTPVFDLALGMIGFKTGFFESSVELPEIAPGEFVVINYVMAAHGDSGLFEQGFSAKIGDPFDLTGGAFLRINPVPEPATLIFLCLGLILLCLTRQRFRLSKR